MSDIARLLQSSLPSPLAILVIVVLGATFIFGVEQVAARLHAAEHIPTPYTRKFVHCAMSTAATLVQLRWGFSGVVIFGVVGTIIILWTASRGEGSAVFRALARQTDSPRGAFFLRLPLLATVLGGLVTNLFFPRFAYIGYVMVGWGDALGEVVGARWGKHRYRIRSLGREWTSGRSLEGSAAVWLGGGLASFLALLTQGFPLTTAAGLALAAGLAGAVAEVVGDHGFDNFSVQVAASATAHFLS
ncbi:MAG TPA: hypothetical protein VGK54_16095 [Chloroflexota bacterium]|jgi:phytol kinase